MDKVAWMIVGAVILAFALVFGVCSLVIPNNDDEKHSLARTEYAARSHDHDGDEEGEGEGGGGTTNFFSPKIDKLVICLPQSSCPQA